MGNPSEKAIRLKALRDQETFGTEVRVQGWVRSRRESKTGVAFVDLNDGSCFDGVQLVIPSDMPGYAEMVPRLYSGTAISASGKWVASQGGKQKGEVVVSALTVLGGSDPNAYPIAKQKMTYEHLRDWPHLRARTNTFGAIARLRHVLSQSVHGFFSDRGFIWLHTPILTGNDCEGAGQVFRVTTSDLEQLGGKAGAYDATTDFFGKGVHLTVSGQLEAESYALSLGSVYTFGPTFRAENSHTSRHLAEFWMVEPEMAFADLDDDMDLAEAFLKHLAHSALNLAGRELDFFVERVEPTVRTRLESLVQAPFERMSYTEAVNRLQASKEKFSYPVAWGHDLQSEHERWLSEKVVGGPLILTDYPKEIKAFYMRANDDGKTVRAMDVLLPHIGEIIGGSQREDRLDLLESRIREQGLDPESLSWYLDLRRYGGAPHAGFGLGFERLVQYVSGMGNIRDVIPFPRTPGGFKV